MIARLARRFAALGESDRRHVTGVALCMALYCFHAVWFSTWLIEDAAISYAYAVNVASGEGFVPTPGAEPVEGFSNPTWTLLLAASSFVGLDPWMMGKLYGVGFGLLAIPLVWAWARRMAPEDDGNWALVAPLVLAMSTQHTLWAASGLENGLFNLLLAAGAVRMLMEGEQPRWGVSGVLLGLLAITRPEAPMYAGMIALIGGIPALQAGGVRWAASFLVGGIVPFGTWHAFRYWTFAWELPNTYYAKQTDEKFQPFAWNRKGWSYLRNWALVSVHGFVVPLFTLGQSGVRGYPGLAGLVLTGGLMGALVTGIGWIRDYGPLDLPAEPEILTQIRIGAIVLAMFAFPMLGVARKGAFPRILAWVLMLCALFFAVYTGGDWMRSYRWLAMAAVPLSVLTADACRELGYALQPLVDWGFRRRITHGAVALGLALPILGGGVGQTVGFMFGLETAPFDVRRRVLYMRGVQDRLHLDRASLLEVDMGAHMMWSGFDLIDMAGLVDVPIAHHHWAPAFLDEYVHEERNPTFAHVHAGWASRTGMDKRPWFRTTYLEIPGYGHSWQTFHVGNHIRRDLIVADAWPGSPGRRVAFGGLVLEGLEIPAPLVHPGGALYVEIGWSIRVRSPGFRALLFLSRGDRVVVRELPPAYDWLPIPQWRTGQVLMGRHTLSLPDDLEPGDWDVGIALVGDDVGTAPVVGVPVDADGRVEAHRVPAEPRFMAGEARFIGALRVAPRAEVVEAATVRFGHAVLAARDGRCEDAGALWSGARRHLAREDAWHEASDPAMADEMGACWAHRAEQSLAPADIAEARAWSHRAPEVRRVGVLLADRWEAEGDAALAAGDDEAAYRGWTDALKADPYRSWVRRRAEEARTRRLGLEDEEESP